MNKSNLKTIAINAIWFKVAWLGCVLYGNPAVIGILPLTLVIHNWWIPLTRRDWTFVVAVVLLGYVVDTFLSTSGILAFPAGGVTPPPWLMMLWGLFATLLLISLKSLVVHRILFVALCAVGGTLSYMAGVTLSPTEFGMAYSATLPVLAITWLLAGLVIHQIHRFIFPLTQHRYA